MKQKAADEKKKLEQAERAAEEERERLRIEELIRKIALLKDALVERRCERAKEAARLQREQ
jgi:hypothetical protein